MIEEFRGEVTRHGTPPIKPHDPTRFKLEDALKMVRQAPLEANLKPPRPPEASEDPVSTVK